MKKCKLLIDEKWEEASLSGKDIKAVISDIKGNLLSSYTIKLDNGEAIDTGIIDDIIIK